MTDLALLLMADMFWSAIAALGFGILFNVPKRWLPWVAAIGAVGHGLRTLLESMGASLEMATLASALLVGISGYTIGKRLRTPVSIFTVPGSIPLVPGRIAYEAMIGLLQVTTTLSVDQQQVLLADAGIAAVRVMVIVAAIAIGIALPALIFDREKPVV